MFNLIYLNVILTINIVKSFYCFLHFIKAIFPQIVLVIKADLVNTYSKFFLKFFFSKAGSEVYIELK
jgi:hypothetical protein